MILAARRLLAILLAIFESSRCVLDRTQRFAGPANKDARERLHRCYTQKHYLAVLFTALDEVPACEYTVHH